MRTGQHVQTRLPGHFLDQHDEPLSGGRQFLPPPTVGLKRNLPTVLYSVAPLDRCREKVFPFCAAVFGYPTYQDPDAEEVGLSARRSSAALGFEAGSSVRRHMPD